MHNVHCFFLVQGGFGLFSVDISFFRMTYSFVPSGPEDVSLLSYSIP